jgi:alpha-glucosidase
MNRLSCVLLVVFLVFAAGADAQWHSIGAVDSFRVLGERSFFVHAAGAVVRVDVVSEAVVRIRLAPHGIFTPDHSEAVVGQPAAGSRPVVEDHGKKILLRTRSLVLEITRSPLRMRFLDHSGTVLNADDPDRGMAWDGAAVRLWLR